MSLALLAVAMGLGSACAPQPTRQARLAFESKQLTLDLENICLRRFADGVPLQQVLAGAALRPLSDCDLGGHCATVYQPPFSGSRTIYLDNWNCGFSVGQQGATSDEISALDSQLAQLLASDGRGWRPVSSNGLGHSWCNAAGTVVVNAWEADPHQPPKGLEVYIHRTELQVSVHSDNTTCAFLSRRG